MRKLPPLNALRAFEAAARHVSFARAAEELHVSSGAVSRHVALLEGWIGRPLFKRTPSELVLSDAGRSYQVEMTALLDRMALATAALKEGASHLLRVSAPPTFNMRWLIPRLSSFQRKHPDVEIRLTASLEPVDFLRNDYDVAIRNRRPAQGWCVASPFLNDIHIPVCHAGLIQDAAAVPSEILRAHPFIAYATMVDPVSYWLGALGCGNLQCLSTLWVEQLYFALKAATDGLGIVVSPLILVLDDILAGRMVAPFGLMDQKHRPYYVCYPDTPSGHPVIKRFAAWLRDEGLDSGRSAQAWVHGMGWKSSAFPPSA